MEEIQFTTCNEEISPSESHSEINACFYLVKISLKLPITVSFWKRRRQKQERRRKQYQVNECRHCSKDLGYLGHGWPLKWTETPGNVRRFICLISSARMLAKLHCRFLEIFPDFYSPCLAERETGQGNAQGDKPTRTQC